MKCDEHRDGVMAHVVQLLPSALPSNSERAKSSSRRKPLAKKPLRTHARLKSKGILTVQSVSLKEKRSIRVQLPSPTML